MTTDDYVLMIMDDRDIHDIAMSCFDWFWRCRDSSNRNPRCFFLDERSLATAARTGFKARQNESDLWHGEFALNFDMNDNRCLHDLHTQAVLNINSP